MPSIFSAIITGLPKWPFYWAFYSPCSWNSLLSSKSSSNRRLRGAIHIGSGISHSLRMGGFFGYLSKRMAPIPGDGILKLWKKRWYFTPLFFSAHFFYELHLLPMDISMFSFRDTSYYCEQCRQPCYPSWRWFCWRIERFAEFSPVCLFQRSIPIKIRWTHWEEFCFL